MKRSTRLGLWLQLRTAPLRRWLADHSEEDAGLALGGVLGALAATTWLLVAHPLSETFASLLLGLSGTVMTMIGGAFLGAMVGLLVTLTLGPGHRTTREREPASVTGQLRQAGLITRRQARRVRRADRRGRPDDRELVERHRRLLADHRQALRLEADAELAEAVHDTEQVLPDLTDAVTALADATADLHPELPSRPLDDPGLLRALLADRTGRLHRLHTHIQQQHTRLTEASDARRSLELDYPGSRRRQVAGMLEQLHHLETSLRCAALAYLDAPLDARSRAALANASEQVDRRVAHARARLETVEHQRLVTSGELGDVVELNRRRATG